MTTDEALLHASNRAAHKVARAARELCKETGPEPWGYTTGTRRLHIELWNAACEYEEAERRAQKEATA